MKGFYQLIKGTLALVVAGAIGAGVILAVTQNEDLLGAASGKKVSKKKKNDLWSDVAREVTKPNIPLDDNNMDNVTPPAGGLPGAKIPDDIGLDPFDSTLCNNNVNIGQADLGNDTLKTSVKVERTILHGQVREFYEDRESTSIICSVEIYPRSCDKTYKLIVAPGVSPAEERTATQICDFLGQASLSERSVFVQAYRNADSRDDQIRNTLFIHRAQSGGSMQTIMSKVQAGEAAFRALDPNIPGARLIDRMFNR